MNGGWNYVLFSMGIVFGAVTTVSDGLSIETNIQCLTGDIDIYIYIFEDFVQIVEIVETVFVSTGIFTNGDIDIVA